LGSVELIPAASGIARFEILKTFVELLLNEDIFSLISESCVELRSNDARSALAVCVDVVALLGKRR
jgi:hypothetical protein